MLKVARDRLIEFVPVLILMSIVVFGILYLLPGDPATAMIAGSGATGELVEQLREALGLNEPAYVQYWRFFSRAAVGDLGNSIASGRLVTKVIAEVAPQTIVLTASSIVLACLIGIPLGILAAVYRNSWIDRLTMLISVIGVSMPQFWMAMLLLLLFSFRLGWVPATGVGGLEHLILPTIVLGYGSASVLGRMVRSSMLEVLSEDYIRTARGKGIKEVYVLVRHAFRNAIIPVITVIGLQIGWLLGGAIIVETVFSRPGIGRLLMQAIISKDFPVVQGLILVITLAYLVINLLTDIFYRMLDPRIL